MTVTHGSIIVIENGKAKVKLNFDEGCGTCPSRGKCKVADHTEIEVLIPPYMAADVNDRVLLALNDNPVALTSLVAYLLPIVCLIIGAMVGSRLDAAYDFNTPVYTLVLAIVCFLTPLIIFRVFKRRVANCAVNRAQLLEVYRDETPPAGPKLT